MKESQGGKLSSRDQKQLEDTERDVARVKKAREVLGDRAPRFDGRGGHRDVGGRGEDRRGRGGYGGLGKRGRDERGEEGDSGSETDESVRKIPWPKDTPPPVPRQQRRDGPPRYSTNANNEPLGAERRIPDRTEKDETVPDTSLPAKPTPVTRTTYESAPQVRDLRKEATARFVPQVVRKKIDATKGKGGKLLEEEEVEALEKEGYGGSGNAGSRIGVGGVVVDAAPAVGEEVGGVEERERERRRLEEEEERFRREMETEIDVGEEREGEERMGPRGVEVEEVSDEDLRVG